MKNNLGTAIRSIAVDFAPLLGFYAINHFFGFKPAIVGSVAITLGALIYFKLRRQKVSAFFKFSAVVSLLFGALDLSLKNPIFFRFEASLTNVITGIFFGLTLFGEKPIIQEFAEKRWQARGEEPKINPDSVYFFKVSTLVWTAYFFIKAGVYAWISSNFSIDKALVMRAATGNVSLYALLFANIFLVKQIYSILRYFRLLPSSRTAAVLTKPRSHRFSYLVRPHPPAPEEPVVQTVQVTDPRS